jgi:uncharacterized protein (DUF58 family)
MTPGSLSIRILAIIGVCGLAVTVLPEVAPFIAIAVVVLIGVAMIEAMQLRRVEVRVDRAPSVALSLDEIERYTMRVSTSASFPVEMEIHQRWPGLVEQRSSAALAICRPGEVVQLEFPLHAIERGIAPVEAPSVRLTRRRLVERIVRGTAEAEMAVTPNLAAVARLHRQLNQFFLRGYGSRTSARLGKGREFDRMRDYVRGDELRDVAWKATARHGRLIVREYRLDRSQDILVCIDTGHRMAARVGHVSRLDHAVNASMLLSYVCNRMEDRVGVIAFDSSVQRGVPAGRGMTHLREVTRFVTGVRPHYRHTDYLALAADLRRRVRHRSLIFLMTVLPELEDHHDLVRAVRMLSTQHLVLITVFADMQLKAASEILPADKRELTNVIVARQLWESRRALTRELRGYGALVVDTPPEEFSVDSVNAYLDVKRRQLL